MQVFGTHLQLFTFIFILLEAGLLIGQLVFYIIKSRDRQSERLIVLLALMLLYNITGGLFPDPSLRLTVYNQTLISYGCGLSMALFFPYYFYKAFDLKCMRWQVLLGIPLFICFPSLVFFSAVFLMNGKLLADIDYGIITPLISLFTLLYINYKVLNDKNDIVRNPEKYLNAASMYGFVGPWVSFAIFGMVENSQFIEVLCTNGSIVGVTILFIRKSIHNSGRDNHIRQMVDDPTWFRNFQTKCLAYKLTTREVEIVLLIRQGLTYKEISEKLFIASKTVENHLQHVYEKTSVNNKVAMLHKLSIAV